VCATFVFFIPMEIDCIFFLAESSSARIHNAYELVDWLRFVEHTLQPQDIARLAAVVERFHPPALKDLFENLHPADSLMWEGGGLKTASRQLLSVYVSCFPVVPASL
jgi:nucleolar pre-ribosomal-associated protein 1